MIELGAAAPDVEVWIRPNERLRTVELGRRGKFLLLFYLYDWSST